MKTLQELTQEWLNARNSLCHDIYCEVQGCDENIYNELNRIQNEITSNYGITSFTFLYDYDFILEVVDYVIENQCTIQHAISELKSVFSYDDVMLVYTDVTIEL